MQAWELAHAVVASKPPFEDRMYVLDVQWLVPGPVPGSRAEQLIHVQYEANYEVVAACAGGSPPRNGTSITTNSAVFGAQKRNPAEKVEN